MMAIEMVGGVYCPLSPLDPQQRLYTLVTQTESRFVLVHHLTKMMFNDNIISVDIDSILTDSDDVCNDIALDKLSNVVVTWENMAYIIFTSGSTGIPKGVSSKLLYRTVFLDVCNCLQVQTRHQNFLNFTYALVDIGALHKDDIVLQLATSTFDVHVQEILASLIFGTTVIMLHPHGNMDFAYFNHVLHDKQVTYLLAVPTFLSHLCNFIQKDTLYSWMSMRNICCVGK